jgi:hypothetical protein
VRDEQFASYAWVNAGNTCLELWQARSNDDLPAGTRLPCVAGLGLWAQDLCASREQLQLAGVACKEPKVWRSQGKDGRQLANFTNCLVIDASGPVCQVFFCEWDPYAPIVPWRHGQSTAQRREQMTADLAACGGGALGLVGLRAISMESPDPAATAKVWAALTDSPSRAAPDVELEVGSSDTLRVAAMIFGVRDLSASRAALQRLDIATRETPGRLWLDADDLSGLRIGLMEA